MKNLACAPQTNLPMVIKWTLIWKKLGCMKTKKGGNKNHHGWWEATISEKPERASMLWGTQIGNHTVLSSVNHPDKPTHSQPSQYLPKLFFVKAFYNALLKGYKTEGLTAEKALDNAMMLIQIFELQITKEEVLRKEMLAVMVSAMKDFGEIWNNKSSIQQRVFQQSNGSS